MSFRFALIPLCALVIGCAPKNSRDVLGLAITAPPARVAVAEPRFYVDVRDVDAPAAPDDMDVWRDNLWVGKIWFAGGYELLEEENNQIRSVEVVLSEAPLYREQALRWAVETSERALRKAGFEVAPAVGPAALTLPTRRDVRGTVALDGGDNINLPRFDLAPGAAVTPGVDTDADAIFVPVVVNYYAHNAGWFIGQEDGCWGGARLRLYWALVAPDDGRLLGWGDLATRIDELRLASPSEQQRQDLLLEIEAEAAVRLAKQLARRKTPPPRD